MMDVAKCIKRLPFEDLFRPDFKIHVRNKWSTIFSVQFNQVYFKDLLQIRGRGAQPGYRTRGGTRSTLVSWMCFYILCASLEKDAIPCERMNYKAVCLHRRL
jgi:hypothetical protein